MNTDIKKADFQCTGMRVPVWNCYVHPELKSEYISFDSENPLQFQVRIATSLMTVDPTELKCFATVNVKISLEGGEEFEPKNFPSFDLQAEIIGFFTYQVEKAQVDDSVLKTVVSMLRTNGCAYLYGALRPMIRSHVLSAAGAELILPGINLADYDDESVVESFLERFKSIQSGS